MSTSGPSAATAAPVRRLSRRRKFAFAAVFVLLLYGVAEVVVSLAWTTFVPPGYWVYEEPQPALVFDAVRGFRIAAAKTRTAKFVRNRMPTTARVVHTGVLPGNSEGFPDRDDFGPTRTKAGVPRWVVCGDSFTGGDLQPNWPDRAEDVAAKSGKPLELLNMSQFGYGLANWHAVLTRLVAARGYDVDGVVFAVWGDDLARRFYVVDHEGFDRHMGGRVESWDPDLLPKTREGAARFLQSSEVFLASTRDFDAALVGAWKPPRAFEFVLTPRIASFVGGLFRGAAPVHAPRAGASAADEFGDVKQGRGRLVAEIRAFLEAKHLKCVVVQVPSLECLVAGKPDPHLDETRAFAKALSAEFVDGARAFDGLDASAVTALWMQGDPHWDQGGSDRFAAWAADEIGKR